jgi:hypothetical protein
MPDKFFIRSRLVKLSFALALLFFVSPALAQKKLIPDEQAAIAKKATEAASTLDKYSKEPPGINKTELWDKYTKLLSENQPEIQKTVQAGPADWTASLSRMDNEKVLLTISEDVYLVISHAGLEEAGKAILRKAKQGDKFRISIKKNDALFEFYRTPNLTPNMKSLGDISQLKLGRNTSNIRKIYTAASIDPKLVSIAKINLK